MTKRAAQLRRYAYLFGGVLVFLVILSLVIQIEERSYQGMRQKGWTTYLQEFQGATVSTFCTPLSGSRHGNIILDTRGRIWVAGGCEGLVGLHTFDGQAWSSQSRNYLDLAADTQGRIWGVTTDGYSVEVFDGQTWKTYDTYGFGLGAQPITQVEVDSHGRIWIVYRQIKEGDWNIVEYINQITVSPEGVLSLKNVAVVDGYLSFFDADNQGMIWAGIDRKSPNPEVTEISLFNGQTLQRLPKQPGNLQDAAGAALDQQGHLSVVTKCGIVTQYDGMQWITIIPENMTDFCSGGFFTLEGMTLDNQGSVWAWGFGGVRYLHENTWITLTPENSGLAGERVFGVLVDDTDHVWIGSSGGINVVAPQDALPLSDPVVNRHGTLSYIKSWFPGIIWFLPSLVVILWLAAYFNLLPGVLLPISVGLLFILISVGIARPQSNSGDRLLTMTAVVAIFVGTFGGIIGGLIDKRHKGSDRIDAAVLLAIVGLFLGGVVTIYLFLLEAIMGN